MGRAVSQWQILSEEPEKSAAFFTELFDWKIDDDNQLGYRRVQTGAEGGIDGGIWPSPPGTKSFVQLFVDVEDVSAAVERAEALGASVIVPPQSLPDGDEMAVLLDPMGMSFAVYRATGRA